MSLNFLSSRLISHNCIFEISAQYVDSALEADDQKLDSILITSIASSAFQFYLYSENRSSISFRFPYAYLYPMLDSKRKAYPAFRPYP